MSRGREVEGLWALGRELFQGRSTRPAGSPPTDRLRARLWWRCRCLGGGGSGDIGGGVPGNSVGKSGVVGGVIELINLDLKLKLNRILVLKVEVNGQEVQVLYNSKHVLECQETIKKESLDKISAQE